MSSPPRRVVTLTRLLAAAVLAVGLLAAAPWLFGGDAAASGRSPVWTRQWTPSGAQSFSGGYLARSATGDLYVAGNLTRADSKTDWVVARFTAAGKRVWVRTLAGPYGDDVTRAVAADADGNVVVVGQVAVGSDWPQTDLMVAKWSRAGRLLWKKRMDGTAHGYDAAKDVVAGPDASFYVVGQMARAGQSDDGVVLRFSARGKLLWSRYIDGPQHGSDQLSAVATDKAGNAYVTGHDYDGGRADDVIVARYTPKGARSWLRRWGDVVELVHDRGNDISVRGSVVAVAGASWTKFSPSLWVDRGLTLKFTTTGVLKWARVRPNSNSAMRTEWIGVGVDAYGRIAVGGVAETWGGVPQPLAWLTTVYSAAGAESAVQLLQGDVQYFNFFAGLASTAAGRVYATGSFGSAASSANLGVVALRPNGSVAWKSIMDAPVGIWDAGQAVVATSTAVFVAGASGHSMVLLKFKP